ncbi:MAG: LacI family DNA-binding transcriptional regulator [Verrucomicrobiota bacterium]
MIKLVDIAEQLGLSRVTVSAVLNDRYKSLGISEATAKRVIKTAADMGYRRNEMAMSMKTGKSFLIGCMTGALGLEWGGRTLEGALLGLRDSVYSMKVESVHSEAENNSAIQRFIGARVSSIFACNVNPTLEEAARIKEQLSRYKILMVCNNCRQDLSHLQVDPDNFGGSLLAVRHLAELGHKHIAFISGDGRSNASLMRKEGFLGALGDCGLSLGPNFLERGNWDYTETEEAIERLMSSKKAPTAILCANDEMAVVAIRRLQHLGYSVPNDVSIIGFTNERLGQLANPALTTVAQPEVEIGKVAIQLLIEKIEAPESEKMVPESRVLPSTLIVRESTSRPPKASTRSRKRAS